MSMRTRFEELAQAIESGCAQGEFACATLEAERSEFVRINGARLRQAGRVERAVARIRLVQDDRQAIHQLTLPGLEPGVGDLTSAVHESLASLRQVLADSAPDPLLDVNREPVQSDDRDTPDGADAFDRAAFMKTVADAAGPADLVGFCAAGPLARGFCSSSGSRQWYQRERVSFDWSIHLPGDAAGGGDRKAVKASWSGPSFNAAAVSQAIADSRRDAQVMTRPVMRLAPGDYRALLSPRAFADLLEMLSWGGFSARAHHAGQSPLAWLRSGKSTLSPMLSMAEDLDAGLAPGFQADGYPRPRRTALIDAGRFADWMVSPRTAREYQLAGNAASDAEMPETLRVQAGSMKAPDALAALGTGLSISNFWYLNFSDRPSARVTGMTRFACLWVDNGEPVAPVEAMRFDDSLYRLLGDQLVALGDTAVLMPAGDTYDGRATGGIEVPAALLGGLRFAL